jgi:guanosine-3',5'-bis(diphosphate) 3'-pyrophosphohydrolase
MKIESDIQFYLKAVARAALEHQCQKRKGKVRGVSIPFINHPINVSNIAAQAGITDVNILVAALFHDAIEDTDMTYDDIKESFNQEVASIVKEVTDDKTLSQIERKRAQIANSESKSTEAKIVKMCDMIDNLTDLHKNPLWSLEKTRGYFIWKYIIFQNFLCVNEELESQLDSIFDSPLLYKGKKYTILPQDENEINEVLENYFKILEHEQKEKERLKQEIIYNTIVDFIIWFAEHNIFFTCKDTKYKLIYNSRECLRKTMKYLYFDPKSQVYLIFLENEKYCYDTMELMRKGESYIYSFTSKDDIPEPDCVMSEKMFLEQFPKCIKLV